MPTPLDSLGVINPEELYTLSAFTRRLGITASTVRAARRSGLRVNYVHKQAYILGRDWIEYVLSSTRKSPQDAAAAPVAVAE